MLDPLTQRHLVGRDVFAGIARVQKIAEGLLRFRLCAVQGLGEAPAIDAIPQAPRFFAALVNPAVPVRAPLAHDFSPSRRLLSSFVVSVLNCW
jgi:hypothetical protein